MWKRLFYVVLCFMFVHSIEIWTRQFPHPLPPASSSVASKHEELEMLYASVARVVSDGLSSFEKASSISSISTSQLQCTLMVLKAACNNDPCYIDRLSGSVINRHCFVNRTVTMGTGCDTHEYSSVCPW